MTVILVISPYLLRRYTDENVGRAFVFYFCSTSKRATKTAA